MALASKSSLGRSDLDALIDRAFAENGSVIIKRPGRKDLAIIPAEKLRKLDTTDYLTASPKNRARLRAALRDARAGKGRAMSVVALRKATGID